MGPHYKLFLASTQQFYKSLYQSVKIVEKKCIERLLGRSQNQHGWRAKASRVISRIIPCLIRAFPLPLLNSRHHSSHNCHTASGLLHTLRCDQRKFFAVSAPLHTKPQCSLGWAPSEFPSPGHKPWL